MSKRVARCPGCLPNTPHGCWDAEFDGTQHVWSCRNCAYKTPVRKQDYSKPSPTQLQLVQRLTNAGWTVSTELLTGGWKLWINATRNGEMLHGTIGRRGSIDLTRFNFLFDDHYTNLTNLNASSVFLRY